jgi:hypothetical protein
LLAGTTCAAIVEAAGGGPEDPFADFAVGKGCTYVGTATSGAIDALIAGEHG